MSITVNIRYTGTGDAALHFAREMTEGETVDRIRAVPGNLRYEYFIPLEDSQTVLLVDSWEDQEAIDRHHASPMMAEIARLRDKYDLHMEVERFISDDGVPEKDEKFIRK